jgi:protein ECT2
MPSTPTASTRSRAAIFGLDAISRNLFNSRSGSIKGDVFGGSINGHKRSKSAVSRSSANTQTTTTGEGSLTKFSRRSNSTTTVATSVSAVEEDSFFASKPISRSRKLLKRAKSPAGDVSPSRSSSKPGSRSNSRSRSPSQERVLCSEDEDEDPPLQQMDQSEWDLAMRLELARQNSQNQHGRQVHAGPMEMPSEATIYEGTYTSLLELS